ncbi:MAG: pectate lyase [Fibrobacterota bacterium]|nr:MAG: pectate lyase [Fibrobacterota bacterium]
MRNNLQLALCALAALAAPALSASASDKAIGWASQNGGTTGGAGGTEVTVTTMADLQKYAKMSGKYVIWVKGTMGSYGQRGEGNADQVTFASDKSVLGHPGARIKGNLYLSGVKNVILRNLIVEGPGACDNDCGSAGESRKDAISIINSATNIWLDHMDVFDGEDGNTDITKGSDFVTISWTKFHYSDKSFPSGTSGKSHRFSNLLGGSDTEASDGKLSVTFFKTWWGEGVAERMPRVRFGKVHIANCLFNSKDPGQNHSVRAGFKANILVEGSAFIGQKKPIDLFDNDFTAITVKNSTFTGCSGNMAGSGTAFTPPYSLTLSAASAVEAEVSNATTGAGATLTWTSGIVARPSSSSALSIQSVPGGLELTNHSAEVVDASLWSLVGQRLSPVSNLVPGASLRVASATQSVLLRTTTQGVTSTSLLPPVR